MIGCVSEPILGSGVLSITLAAGCVSNPLLFPISGVCGLLERTRVRDSPIAVRPREFEGRPFLSGSDNTMSPNLAVLGGFVSFLGQDGQSQR